VTKPVSEMSEEEYERHRSGRLRRRKEKQEKLYAMFDNACVDCGMTETRVGFFEFHHEDPAQKDREIGSMLNSASFDKVLEEVAKCVMLCPNCHKRRHLEDGMTLSKLRSKR
jgi:predicted HNH restriction endonuclease